MQNSGWANSELSLLFIDASPQGAAPRSDPFYRFRQLLNIGGNADIVYTATWAGFSAENVVCKRYFVAQACTVPTVWPRAAESGRLK